MELIEFWSRKDIQADLNFAESQPSPVIIVAQQSDCIIGFSWGYKIPSERFPFLKGRVSQNASYMDEIAVRKESRGKGVGLLLGNAYINTSRTQGFAQIVLRTDERNSVSMGLFKKLGFKNLGITDPEFKWRTYLEMSLT